MMMRHYRLLVLVILVVSAQTIFPQAGQNTKPLTYGLVIDNSGSLRSQWPKVMEIARLVVSSNISNDETFIVGLIQETKAALVVDVTTDKFVLFAGVSSLRIRPGQTALIDGIYSSADYISQLQKKVPDRRYALIIVSDGEERASAYKPKKLLELLKQLKCPLFFVGFLDELDQTGGLIKESPRDKARKLIEQLTKETGGGAFFVEKNTDPNKLIDELTKALRS